MTDDVHIYEVYVGETTTPMWLCANDRDLRAKGRGARPPKQLDEPVGFQGKCDDCVTRASGVSMKGPPSFSTTQGHEAYERGEFLTDPMKCDFPQPAPAPVFRPGQIIAVEEAA